MTDADGHMAFLKRYGVAYDSLIKIPKISDNGIYRQNYDVLYDLANNRLFSLWHSPYKSYIQITADNRGLNGFITLDENLRRSYTNEYIQCQLNGLKLPG